MGQSFTAKERSKKYRENNRQRTRDSARKWVKNNSQRKQAYTRFYKTGFTSELVTQRLESQNNKCAICLASFDSAKANADHNHSTGQCRGMLCTRCNAMLGMAKENKNTLSQAIKYLDLWEKS